MSHPNYSPIAFVFGSRKIVEFAHVACALDQLLLTPPPASNYHLRHQLAPPPAISEVWSGAAPGADRLAARWCQLNGIKVREYPAKWKVFGRRAGILRTCMLVAMLPANSLCVCFAPPDARQLSDLTPGSQHSVRECQKRYQRVLIVWPDGDIRPIVNTPISPSPFLTPLGR